MPSFASHPRAAPRLHGASLLVLAALAVVGVVCAAGAWSGACAATASQQGWAWQNPLPQGNAIHAVRFAADKLTGWAVGADGVILRTRDGGFRWDEQHSRTAVPLYGLYVKDARRAVAVGARGVVARRRPDGGEQVEAARRPSRQRDHLYGVAFAPDAAHGWAVGSYGQIVKTPDGGRTWRRKCRARRAHLYAVAFADARHGVAAGADGALLVTEDGGATWIDRTIEDGAAVHERRLRRRVETGRRRRLRRARHAHGRRRRDVGRASKSTRAPTCSRSSSWTSCTAG